VDSEIAISGVEPDGLAELTHVLQAEKSIPLHAPAALATQHAGENVRDGVDVGRNVESPPEQIVSRIDNEREFFGGENLAQAIHKFCAAGAARQHRDHAALRAWP